MFFRKKSDDPQGIKSRSVFLWIVKPLVFLTILNAVILLLVLYVMRVPYQLNKNSYDLCQKQVDNRQRYLQTQMTTNWIHLDDLSSYITSNAQHLINEGSLDLAKLDSSTTECTPLILSVTDRMIQELYSHKVSGIYLIFNTHNLEEDMSNLSYQEKTGIYIQDKDPLSASSEKFSDLLLLCSPPKIVQQKSLSTARNWEQKFKFSNEAPYEEWFTVPYSTALNYPNLSASDCGFWSIKMNGEEKASLTYSIPLFLSNGIPYGVLGIEILPSYMETLLPYNELDESSFYGLYFSDEDALEGKIYSEFSRNAPFALLESIKLKRSAYDGYELQSDEGSYEAALSPLPLYSRNTPFENLKWYVLGAVPKHALYDFSNRVTFMLIFTSMLILLFGTVWSMIASWKIAKPILSLQQELSAAQPGSIPDLSRTGISEVDDFATAITDLSQNVVNSSKRFLSIMEMSSIDMGGYEVDEENDFIFVTDNFFSMFNRPELDSTQMTCASFLQMLNQIHTENVIEQASLDYILYAIRDASGTVRYIHVQETRLDSRRIGVAEDVTFEVLERKHLERERDYDLLTGIYNRRAFVSEASKLLTDIAPLGVAIAVMLDLDNLKSFNDVYGHEWGDFYIISAAKTIVKHAPQKSVCARVSGDEFNLLFYGFADEAEAEQAMKDLWEGFHATVLNMPDGQILNISASGGYAIVSEQCKNISQLIKYADFAMYRTKRTRKGWYEKFEFDQYQAFEMEREMHSIFKRIIQQRSIRYVFQPIISARTGKIFGVEALMRVMDHEQMSLADFLRIAKQEDALDEIERLTWYHALPAFRSLLKDGVVSPDTKLFINSQVNHLLSPAEQRDLIMIYSDIRDNVVMEVVETDDLAIDFSYMKSQKDLVFSKFFALDDYGTGYNSEKNLISLMPDFIKLDMSLIRDVEKYQERQKLIAGVLSFAHEKDMLVLAEGVETIAELYCLLSLGVDLFQGYLFARPSEDPANLNQEALDMLQNFMMSGESSKNK